MTFEEAATAIQESARCDRFSIMDGNVISVCTNIADRARARMGARFPVFDELLIRSRRYPHLSPGRKR